jgi:hypothetical protein
MIRPVWLRRLNPPPANAETEILDGGLPGTRNRPEGPWPTTVGCDDVDVTLFFGPSPAGARKLAAQPSLAGRAGILPRGGMDLIFPPPLVLAWRRLDPAAKTHPPVPQDGASSGSAGPLPPSRDPQNRFIESATHSTWASFRWGPMGRLSTSSWIDSVMGSESPDQVA